MLANYPIHAALAATDLERARRFYSEKLGLTPESEAPGGIFYRSGETRLLVFPSGETASGTHTQLAWTVDDIESEVAALKARGVIFKEYIMSLARCLSDFADSEFTLETPSRWRMRAPSTALAWICSSFPSCDRASCYGR